jgi:hypothetical protein
MKLANSRVLSGQVRVAQLFTASLAGALHELSFHVVLLFPCLGRPVELRKRRQIGRYRNACPRVGWRMWK